MCQSDRQLATTAKDEKEIFSRIQNPPRTRMRDRPHPGDLITRMDSITLSDDVSDVFGAVNELSTTMGLLLPHKPRSTSDIGVDIGCTDDAY